MNTSPGGDAAGLNRMFLWFGNRDEIRRGRDSEEENGGERVEVEEDRKGLEGKKLKDPELFNILGLIRFDLFHI